MAQIESIVSGASGSSSKEKEWTQRERELLEEIDSSIVWYNKFAQRNRIYHRILGVMMLVASVLAPTTVALTSSTSTSIQAIAGLPTTYIAIALTIFLALAECLRRFFRFEQMWASACLTKDALKSLKDEYCDDQIGNVAGSDQWIKEFRELRKSKNAILGKEEKDFFQVVLSESAKLSADTVRPDARHA